jgi:hypothetical protein
VPVELSAATSIRLYAYIDTGAADCIFQKEYAEALDLTPAAGQMKRFSTASGAVLTAQGHNLQLTALGMSVDTLVYFADDPQFRRNVLGRQGWLDRVRLALVHYESTLYLSPYD